MPSSEALPRYIITAAQAHLSHRHRIELVLLHRVVPTASTSWCTNDGQVVERSFVVNAVSWGVYIATADTFGGFRELVARVVPYRADDNGELFITTLLDGIARDNLGNLPPIHPHLVRAWRHQQASRAARTGDLSAHVTAPTQCAQAGKSTRRG